MSWNFTAQGPPAMQQQQMHYQQNHPQYCQQGNSQHYGSYGNFYQQNVFQMNAWQAYSMSGEQELAQLFEHHVNKSESNVRNQGIQAEDLCELLNQTQSIRAYYGINWSRELCSILLAMLDRSVDGFMQWPEFVELQRCLLAWHNMFREYDQPNRNGYIEAIELSKVVQRFGYSISAQMMTTLLKRYSRVISVNGCDQCVIAFDDFVSLCVRLRAYTDAFRKRDRLTHGGQETGESMFGYDDFLRCVMCL